MIPMSYVTELFLEHVADQLSTICYRAVKFSAKLMGKALARRVRCKILYATETGKSEGFAKILCQIFKHAFDPKVVLPKK